MFSSHLINTTHDSGAVETPRPTNDFGRACCPSPPLGQFHELSSNLPVAPTVLSGLLRNLLPALLMSLSLPASAQTRVALVSTCGGEAGQNVLALADAALSAETNMVLVERREVERILNEQKLTRCGLSDSAQAIAVGKLLGVEVFATLETFPWDWWRSMPAAEPNCGMPHSLEAASRKQPKAS
jgi:hypothetical protein